MKRLNRISTVAMVRVDTLMRRSFAIAVVAAAALAGGAAPRALAAEVLITQAEGALPTPPDLAALNTRGLTRGPRVEQVSPDPHGKGAKSPFPLEIKFIAHNDTTVDPATVTVTYLKSPSVDLTPRLKGHITPAGIDMSDAEVPPGTHMLRIDVRDSQGRHGTSIVKLSVLP
jgi:hypothetical protein